MSSPSQNKLSFLERAKRIDVPESVEKKPKFLQKAKLVSAPENEYMKDEEVEKEIERSQAQLTSRAIEGIAGLPGDIVNLVGGLFGLDPGLPGSEKLREFSEGITKGYTKPKNEFEEQMGEVFQDIAGFAIPGAKHYSFARNLGIPIVANLAKEGIKYFGGSEQTQAASKIGSMVILDLLSHRKGLGSAKQYASSLFQQAEEALPKGVSIKASNLETSLDALEKTLRAGGERPSTGDALKKIGEIRGKIKNGKIDLKEMTAFRPAINEIIDQYKGFDIAVKPKIREKIIHNLNQVKRSVIKSAEEYGEHFNPEYAKLSKAANESYAAVEQSNKIANFIQKHASSKIKSAGLKTLLGLGATGAIGGTTALAGLGIGGAATAAGSLGYKSFKTILRMKSPVLRKHYFKILEGAAKGNSGQVVKNIKFLDEAFQDMEKTGELNQ